MMLIFFFFEKEKVPDFRFLPGQDVLCGITRRSILSRTQRVKSTVLVSTTFGTTESVRSLSQSSFRQKSFSFGLYQRVQDLGKSRDHSQGLVWFMRFFRPGSRNGFVSVNRTVSSWVTGFFFYGTPTTGVWMVNASCRRFGSRNKNYDVFIFTVPGTVDQFVFYVPRQGLVLLSRLTACPRFPPTSVPDHTVPVPVANPESGETSTVD